MDAHSRFGIGGPNKRSDFARAECHVSRVLVLDTRTNKVCGPTCHQRERVHTEPSPSCPRFSRDPVQQVMRTWIWLRGGASLPVACPPAGEFTCARGTRVQRGDHGSQATQIPQRASLINFGGKGSGVRAPWSSWSPGSPGGYPHLSTGGVKRQRPAPCGARDIGFQGKQPSRTHSTY